MENFEKKRPSGQRPKKKRFQWNKFMKKTISGESKKKKTNFLRKSPNDSASYRKLPSEKYLLDSCEADISQHFKEHSEINRRSVLAMRCIDQGLSALNTFCTIMSLPKPVPQKAYDSINIRIADECETLANASMSDATLEEKFSMEHVTALLSVGMAHGKLVDIHHLLVCAR
ncbi:hypothetical protein TNCV_2509491 [Trichonephila clavipes]|nr:hypothetical protein TNCV_2509491 [Trichonephila clavipes]